MRCCLKLSETSFARAEPLAGLCHGLLGQWRDMDSAAGVGISWDGRRADSPAVSEGRRASPSAHRAPAIHTLVPQHALCFARTASRWKYSEGAQAQKRTQPEVYPGHFSITYTELSLFIITRLTPNQS